MGVLWKHDPPGASVLFQCVPLPANILLLPAAKAARSSKTDQKSLKQLNTDPCSDCRVILHPGGAIGDNSAGPSHDQ